MSPMPFFTQALAALRSFSFNKISDREFQRHLDIYRLFIAVKCNDIGSTSTAAAAASAVAEAKSIADRITHEQRLSHLLQHTEAGALRLLLLQHHAAAAAAAQDAHADAGVVVQRSGARDAGLGLFARVPIACGSVVTFHPGKVYTRKDSKDLDLMKRVTAGNDYTFYRDDGVLFDAAAWCGGAAGFEGQRGIALGHLINHPPPDCLVNCAPLAFDGGGAWPAHLKQLIPNTMFAPLLPHQQPRGSCVPMLLLIATDDVAAGQELFMEYVTPFPHCIIVTLWPGTASTPGCAARGPRGITPWMRARCSDVGAYPPCSCDGGGGGK
jgi:hypothetical protein